MTFSSLLTITLGVLTLVAALASALAIIRTNLSKATIETLTTSNTALTARVDFLEKDGARKDVALAAFQSENKALQTYVSGTDAIKELAGTLNTSDQKRGSEHVAMQAILQAGLDAEVSRDRLRAEADAARHEELLALIKAVAHTHEA